MRLSGKVAFVTGGGSGIGLATARLLKQEGAIVGVADRDEAAVQAHKSELDAVHLVDVSRSGEVSFAIGMMAERFGRIDVLVNNAGYGMLGTVETISEPDWDALIGTNLKGVFLCSKYAIPVMARGGGGSIINMGSYTANVGIPNRAAYVASKGGITALTRAMALDHVHQRIRVNCVAPGTIQSPYFDRMKAQSDDPDRFQRTLDQRSPMGRTGRPEEIARMILWLASDESSFATGGVFTVDGGSSIWSGPEGRS